MHGTHAFSALVRPLEIIVGEELVQILDDRSTWHACGATWLTMSHFSTALLPHHTIRRILNKKSFQHRLPELIVS